MRNNLNATLVRRRVISLKRELDTKTTVIDSKINLKGLKSSVNEGKIITKLDGYHMNGSSWAVY